MRRSYLFVVAQRCLPSGLRWSTGLRRWPMPRGSCGWAPSTQWCSATSNSRCRQGPDGTGVVRQVYVHPEARELGLGDDLLEAAIAATVAAGGATIESVALPGDRETKNLFERAGLTARLITVAKRLA